MIEGPLCAEEHNLTVAEVFQNGMWNWEATSFAFPTEVQERVRAAPMQMYGDRVDTLLWKLSRDGDLTTALADGLIIAEAEGNLGGFQGNLGMETRHMA